MTEPKNLKFSESITTKKMILFSLQGIISGFLFGMWGQVQFFAVSVLLIPQALIAIIYLVYSLVDAVNDPLVGYLADKSTRFTTKWGKRYPWILFGVGIGPVFLILCFIPISTNILVNTIWLLVIMGIYETFMTSYEINHNALFPDLIREASHRRKIVSIGAILGGVFTIITAGLIPQLIVSIGYLGTVIVVVIVAYILIIPYSYGIREPAEMKMFRARLEEAEEEKAPLKEVVKRVFNDRNWMGIVIVVFMWSVAGACWIYGLNYFMVGNLGLDIGWTAMPLLMQNLIGFALAPIWAYISKKIGVRKAFIAGMVCNMIVYFAFLFVTDILGVIITFAFAGIGFSATYGVITGLLRAEGIDNATVTTGKREEGTYMGVLKIFTAFSYFFQTVIFAIIGGFTGYGGIYSTGDNILAELGLIFQKFITPVSNIAKLGLNLQMSIIPLVITLIGTIAFFLMYRISKEDAIKNKKKLEEMNL
jgi:GPH family glycoside/pentoside/hexuronide:cation symporter